jgi:hypothetical protein
MSKSVLLAVAGALIATATPAFAATVDEAGGTLPAAATKAPPAAKPTKYCIIDETTGSRIRHKVCLTREGWTQRGVDITAK